MLEVVNVSKYYGALAAVRDVSFAVRPGEVLGYLGPNGIRQVDHGQHGRRDCSSRPTAISASTAKTSGTTCSGTGAGSGTCRRRPTSIRT